MQQPAYIAQANIARGLAPLTDPLMREFVDQIDYINSVAERSPGFVWRLKTDEGDATAIRLFDDPLLVLNASVWESVEALRDYVFRSDHLEPLRNRRQWFGKLGRPHSVLWWIPPDHRPDIDEIAEKLDSLRDRGPAPDAFTFGSLFDSGGRPMERSARRDERCER